MQTSTFAPKPTVYAADRSEMKAHLVGGGIASLAAAAFLIRDGHLHGHNITLYEQLDRVGGSLDGSGTAEEGYILRGGRMFEQHYQCTYDLFSSIPTLDKSKTVTQEIMQWNEVVETSSKSRLVRAAKGLDTPPFGLRERHILGLERLAIEPEVLLGRSSIQDHFDPSFFGTNFWIMWCTTFAFQPWHSAVEFKRYLLRFVHMVDGFSQLKGIMRTVLNQQDSLVRPLKSWLMQHGVRFVLDARVTRLDSRDSEEGRFIERIVYERSGEKTGTEVRSNDLVLVTLGSMTEASNVGTRRTPGWLLDKYSGASWTLWEDLAEGNPELGRPAVFSNHVGKSKWISFTGTCHGHAFFDFMRDFTGNVPGEGGLVTLADSAWLMSVVLPHQPHFIGQPDGVDVFWGYALAVDRQGDFIDKPMTDCGGDEILQELLGHLGHTREAGMTQEVTILPCTMPFITSQFLCREQGDRPEVVPKGWSNLGLVGQFVELPDDVVFTVEYSVRSAQTAVSRLLRLDVEPPPVFKGQFNPGILLEAFKAIHDFGK